MVSPHEFFEKAQRRARPVSAGLLQSPCLKEVFTDQHLLKPVPLHRAIDMAVSMLEETVVHVASWSLVEKVDWLLPDLEIAAGYAQELDIAYLIGQSTPSMKGRVNGIYDSVNTVGWLATRSKSNRHRVEVGYTLWNVAEHLGRKGIADSEITGLPPSKCWINRGLNSIIADLTIEQAGLGDGCKYSTCAFAFIADYAKNKAGRGM